MEKDNKENKINRDGYVEMVNKLIARGATEALTIEQHEHLAVTIAEIISVLLQI